MEQKSKNPLSKTIARITILTLTATLTIGCVNYTFHTNDFLTRHLPPEEAKKLKQKDAEYLFKLCELLEQNKNYETLNEEELEIVRYNRRSIKHDPTSKDLRIKSLKDLKDRSRIYITIGPDTFLHHGSSNRPLDLFKCLRVRYNVTSAYFKEAMDVIKHFKNDLYLEKAIIRHNLPICYYSHYRINPNSYPADFIIKISCPSLHIEKEFISKNEGRENYGTPEDLKAYYELNREMYNWLKRELQIRNLLKEENIK